MWFWILGFALVTVVLYDLFQKRHAILRSFPIIGHFRYILEAIGPELRQYIVTDNDEELPFSRDQRRWIYASSKKENNYFGFGTDNELEKTSNYIIIKHCVMGAGRSATGEAYGKAGTDETYPLPCAKILGGARGRARAFPARLRREHLCDELRFVVERRRERNETREPGSPDASKTRVKGASPLIIGRAAT